MDPMANNTEKTDIVRVLTVFKRKWNYHFWTIFVQSVVLIGVAYMTFYFKLSNFQVENSPFPPKLYLQTVFRIES